MKKQQTKSSWWLLIHMRSKLLNIHLAVFSGNQNNVSLWGDFMVFGRPALRCPANSCLGRCNMSADKSSLCSCDEHCRTLGDCCVDAHFHCFGAKPGDAHVLLPKEEDPIFSSSIRGSMTCVSLVTMGGINAAGSRPPILRYYNMISSCPVGTSGDVQCSDDDTNVLHATPICLPRLYLIFRNIYCLRCHGFSGEEAVAFSVNLPRCDHWQGELNRSVPLETATLLDSFWQYCGYLAQFSLPKVCETTADRMQCPRDLVEKQCPAYSNPVRINGSIYKNQFCAPSIDADIQCLAYNERLYQVFPGYNTMVFISFRVLLDFSNGYHVGEIEFTDNGNNKHIDINGSSKNVRLSFFCVATFVITIWNYFYVADMSFVKYQRCIKWYLSIYE